MDTPVLVYTLGNSRTLYFRKRKVIMGKASKPCWKNDPLPTKEILLCNNSLFMLHPDDEKPQKRYHTEGLSQFQHGNVNVKEGDLSIALVFCHCTKTLIYDHIASKRVIDNIVIENNKENFAILDSTYSQFNEYLSSFQVRFSQHVTSKLQTWKWY